MAEPSQDPTDHEDEPQQGPQEPHPRVDHYEAKRGIFLEHLALTSSVKQSAQVADIPNSTLYLWQERYPEFAAAWLKALAAGYELLEMEMLERARQGVERKIYYHGELIETVQDFDNKMCLQLLQMHKQAVALVRAAQITAAAEQAAQAEPVRDTLDEKLKKVNERLRAYQAEKRRKQECVDRGGTGTGECTKGGSDGR